MARTTTHYLPTRTTASPARYRNVDGRGCSGLPVPLLSSAPSAALGTATPQHDVYRVEYETYRALPPEARTYSEYDFSILAEIITLAEFNAAQAYQKGTGTGYVTLQRLLRAYEVVLPRHGVQPEQDIFYYRFLLKLSLDADPDWWGKFYREARSVLDIVPAGLGRGEARGGVVRSSSRSLPGRRMSQDGLQQRQYVSAPRSASTGRDHTSLRAQHGGTSTSLSTDSRSAGIRSSMSRSARDRATSIGRDSGSHRRDGATSPGHPGRQSIWRDGATSPGRYGRDGSTSPGRFGRDGATSLHGRGEHDQATSPGRHGFAGHDQSTSPGHGLDSNWPNVARLLLPASVHSAGTDVGYFPGSPHAPPRQPRDGLAADLRSGHSSEAEAFAEYSCLARAFRIWWERTHHEKTSREVQERAVNNWLLATTFWETQLLRRMLTRWRASGKLEMARALAHWSGSALQGYFRWWLSVTRQLRAKGEEGDAHSSQVLGRKVMRAWRETTAEARARWGAADLFLFAKGRGRLLRHWAAAAREQRRDREAEDAIRTRSASLVQWNALRRWMAALDQGQHDQEAEHLIRAHAAAAAQSRIITRWHHHFQRRERHERIMTRAVAKLHNGRLASAWNTWSELLEGVRERKALAEQFSARVASQRLWSGLQFWRDWKDARKAKTADVNHAMRIIKRAVMQRALQAWRQHAKDFRRSYDSLQLMLRMAVARCVGAALVRWRRAYAQRTRARHLGAVLLTSQAGRILRSWKALSTVRYQRRTALGVQLAVSHQRRRVLLLHAWRVAAGHLAEDRRLIAFNLTRLKRRQLAGVVSGWRDNVVHRAGKRLRLLAAITHWDRGVTSRAWRGWTHKIGYWRLRRALKARAMSHHHTRLMDLTMAGLLLQWQEYQGHAAVAMQFAARRHLHQQAAVLEEWRQAALWLQVKHHKTRRALAHWMSNLLGVCLYGWHIVTQHQRQMLTLTHRAAEHWGRGVARLALRGWHAFATWQADRYERATAFLALLMDRRLAEAFNMLRANALRKRRGDIVLAHRTECVARKVLRGLGLRVALAEHFHACLLHAGEGYLALLVIDTWNAWVEYVLVARDKKLAIYRALGFYFTQCKRMAFSTLRWHCLRRQMARTCLTKHYMALAAGVLREWRLQAGHNRELRARFALIQERSSQRVMNEQLSAWRQWSSCHLGKRQKTDAAGHYWSLATRRRAWDGWRNYCSSAARASRAIERMIQRRLGHQFGGWYRFMRQRRATGQQVAAVQQRWKRRDMADAFNALLGYAAKRGHKSQQLAAAGDFWMQRTGREMFLAWMETAWTLPRARKALDLWASNTLRLVFHQWRSAVTRRRTIRETGQIIARRWRNVELSGALLGWLGRVEVGRQKKSRLLQALMHWHSHNCAVALKGWMEVAYDRKRLREVSLEVAARMRRRLLASAFDPWRELTTHLAHVGEYAQQMYWHVTRRLAMDPDQGTFARWRDHTRRMRQCRGLLEQVLRRNMHSAFDSWRSSLARSKSLRGVSSSVAIRHRSNLKQRHFRWWKAWSRYLSHLAHTRGDLDRRHKARSLRRSFGGWHNRSGRSALARRHFTDKMERYKQESFRGWLGRSHQGKLARRHLKTLLDRYRRDAWHGWRSRSKVGSQARQQYENATRRRIRTALQLWRRYAQACGLARRHWVGQEARYKRLAFYNWRACLVYGQENRDKLQVAVARMRHRALASAWSGWVAATQHWAHKRAAMTRVLGHMRNRLLAQSFGKWRFWSMDSHHQKAAVMHYFGRLQDRAWAAWTGVASHQREERKMTRAVAMHWMGSLRRSFTIWRQRAHVAGRIRRMLGSRVARTLDNVFAAWRQVSQHLRTERVGTEALLQGLASRLALRVVGEWRKMTQALRVMSRLYTRRALLGWHERARHWAAQRQRLRQIGAVLLFGKLARCFQEWQHYAEIRQVKATVFSRKQRALHGALLIGDQIREQRRLDVLTACFTAWSLQASIFGEVSRRFAVHMSRGLAAAFQRWRKYALEDKDKNLHKAVELANKFLVRRVWDAWHEAIDLAAQKHDALKRVMQIVMRTEKQALLGRCFTRWCTLRDVHDTQLVRAEALAAACGQRLMARAFDVWLRFQRAMATDVDPDTPFLSPRSSHEDRRLVRRVALMSGSAEVEPGSDASSEVFGNIFVSDRLLLSQLAKEKLQAYIGHASALRPGSILKAAPSAAVVHFKQYDDQVEQDFRMMSVAASLRRPSMASTQPARSFARGNDASTPFVAAKRHLAPAFDDFSFDDRVELQPLYADSLAGTRASLPRSEAPTHSTIPVTPSMVPFPALHPGSLRPSAVPSAAPYPSQARSASFTSGRGSDSVRRALRPDGAHHQSHLHGHSAASLSHGGMAGEEDDMDAMSSVSSQSSVGSWRTAPGGRVGVPGGSATLSHASLVARHGRVR